MMKTTFQSYITKIENNVWVAAIYVPKSIADTFIIKQNKRVLCTVNNLHTFHAALMPFGNGDSFININAEIRKKLKLELQDKVEIVLEKDNSIYGMPLPNELKVAWELDEQAYQAFHKMTIGKQRSLIHMVGKLKSTDKRIEKSLIMLDYIKSVDGNLDFKELNEAFKQQKYT